MSKEGFKFFVRSDIRDFFTKIPKDRLKRLMEYHLDGDDLALFMNAVHVDLRNAEELGELRKYFPSADTGVAQGCCLSPFVGNAVLADFDSTLNSIPDVQCIRYVDDFIIVAKSETARALALDMALEILRTLHMDAYDPRKEEEKAKAEMGLLDGSFSFLGCDFSPGRIQPGSKSIKRFKDSISKSVDESIQAFKNPETVLSKHHSLRETLTFISLKSQGWSKHYGFCNCKPTLESIDQFIDTQLSRLIGAYSAARKKATKSHHQRNLIGVYCVATKHGTPILEER